VHPVVRNAEKNRLQVPGVIDCAPPLSSTVDLRHERRYGLSTSKDTQAWIMSRTARAEKLTNLHHENLRMRRGATVIGDILYAPGGACGPRIQHDYQLVVIHHGFLDLKLDEERIHVGQGQGILLSPGHREYFIFSDDQETHHSWCAIHPKAIPQELRRQFRTFRGPIPFAGRMHTLLEMSRRPQFVSLPEEPLQAGFYLGLGLALMCDFASAVRGGKASNTAAEAVLTRMEDFLWKEFASPLSLHDVAKAVGVSRQHLLKVCRIHGKPTPMAQLYAARLEVATDLLRQTGLPISAVAEKCGFVSMFHFSRKFKEAYGESPAAWRSGLWQAAGHWANRIAAWSCLFRTICIPTAPLEQIHHRQNIWFFGHCQLLRG
jgi:AraC-like DNA-binding protein